MQKVFSLEPSNQDDIESLQCLLNEGWEVIFATPQKVAIAGGGHSGTTNKIEGKIVYILKR